jgi:hypothetical protein
MQKTNVPQNERIRKPGKFDFYSIAKEDLVVARLAGDLDTSLAERVVEFVETKEAVCAMAFNRLCDMTGLEGVDLSTTDVLQLAERRRLFNPNDIHVKSAFVATDPLCFGIARMYEQMLNSPRIEVRVWDDLQAAADWLGVDVNNLKL